MNFLSGPSIGNFALLLFNSASLAAASPDDPRASANTSCSDGHATIDTTRLDFSLTSDPSSISVVFEGRSLISANVTVNLQLLSKDEEEVYSSVFDPCADVGIPDLCPLAEGPFNATISRPVPEMFGSGLKEAEIGRVSLEIASSAGEDLQSCDQVEVASGEEDEGAGSAPGSNGNSSNSTSSPTEPMNGSSSDTANATASDNKDNQSSASLVLYSSSKLLYAVVHVTSFYAQDELMTVPTLKDSPSPSDYYRRRSGNLLIYKRAYRRRHFGTLSIALPMAHLLKKIGGCLLIRCLTPPGYFPTIARHASRVIWRRQ